METDTVKIAVLASGTGSNFKALVEGDTAPGVVDVLVTDNERAGVLQLADELGVEGRYMYPGKFRTRFGNAEEKQWADFLEDRGIQLVCLAGLMRILKGPLLEAFHGRILNIHPSLLPAFPGLDAQGQAFRYGVKVAGCTVHYVDQGTDTGPVILQRAVPVYESDTRDSLAARILTEEHMIYSEAVKAHCEGRAVYSRVVRQQKE
ncbi:MAG: phosphoribosylglycinamide formyltransferase [Candidatus Fermentibacteraceae bacterium]|nr:phosphoribosylglycinamide formyltransferase [Candidatus Fermentibacteraceae bacterium]